MYIGGAEVLALLWMQPKQVHVNIAVGSYVAHTTDQLFLQLSLCFVPSLHCMVSFPIEMNRGHGMWSVDVASVLVFLNIHR